MKIYVNQKEVGELKEMVRRRGQLLTFLQGVEIAQRSEIEITPIYSSLARWERTAGLFILVIGWKFPLLLISLQKRWPPLRVMRLEEKDMEN